MHKVSEIKKILISFLNLFLYIYEKNRSPADNSEHSYVSTVIKILQISSVQFSELKGRLQARSSQYSRTMSALLLPLLVCVTPLVSGQLTNCEVGWLDGGTTLGCLLLDNNAMTWMEAVMYCSTLSVSGASPTLAKIER